MPKRALKNNKKFIDELIKEFPNIQDEILDEDYSFAISLQVGVFRRFTQRAIDNNDLELVKKCFDLVARNMDLVAPRIENSLVISYLGKLNIPSNSAVEKFLPQKFKSIIDMLDTYYSTPPKNEKLNVFLKGSEHEEGQQSAG